MNRRREGGLADYPAADANCENCGRQRRFWKQELRQYAAVGHSVESFGDKLVCKACRERGRGCRNVSLIMRPIELASRSA